MTMSDVNAQIEHKPKKTRVPRRSKATLNQREEAFCQEIAKGLSNAAAARNAGYLSQPSVTAWNLMQRPKVTARVEQLRRLTNIQVVKNIARDETITIQSHLAELAQIRDLAKADNKWIPALDAEVKRGEVAGFYSVKAATTPPTTQDVNVKQALGLAMRTLQQHGVELDKIKDAQGPIIDATIVDRDDDRRD